MCLMDCVLISACSTNTGCGSPQRPACPHELQVYYIIKHLDPVMKFDIVEKLALMTASIVHDVDHMGLNNSFHLKCDTPMGILSSSAGIESVLEIHHCKLAIEILSIPDHNVFHVLSEEESTRCPLCCPCGPVPPGFLPKSFSPKSKGLRTCPPENPKMAKSFAKTGPQRGRATGAAQNDSPASTKTSFGYIKPSSVLKEFFFYQNLKES